MKTAFKELLLISSGSIPGALIRWHFGNHFWVNVIGAVVFGFFITMPFNAHRRILLCVGFCGALTTFSSWIYNCLDLVFKGNFLGAIGLLSSTICFGICGIMMGIYLNKFLIR